MGFSAHGFIRQRGILAVLLILILFSCFQLTGNVQGASAKAESRTFAPYASGVTDQTLHPPNNYFSNSRSLQEWVGDLADLVPDVQWRAVEALSSVGSNAIPELDKILRSGIKTQQPLAATTLGLTSDATPTAKWNGANCFVGWRASDGSQFDLSGTYVSRSGDPTGPPFVISADPGDERDLSLVTDGQGRVFAVYCSIDTYAGATNSKVFASSYDPQCVATHCEFNIDCTACLPSCGDGSGTCDLAMGEDCSTCPSDCGGPCLVDCGDGICGAPNETCSNCADCGPCSTNDIPDTCNPEHASYSAACDAGETCWNCPRDCRHLCGGGIATCGNGAPDAGEDCSNCPADTGGPCLHTGSAIAWRVRACQ